MLSQGSILSSALKGFAAIRGFFAKSPRKALTKDELRTWLKEQPDIAEEARRGFEAIDAGRYQKVSRRGTS